MKNYCSAVLFFEAAEHVFLKTLNIIIMNYEVKGVNGNWAVWNIKDSTWITKEIPDKKIAEEICEDFNKMSNKDFTPIGMPNFPKIFKK